MEPPDDTTKKSAEVDADSATSTESDGEADDETGGFIFGNNLESDDGDDTLSEREQERVVDLVRLQPTKNAELQDQWRLASGSDVHQYLESELKGYYYRDGDGYIRATDTAEEFVQNHQDVYQDVTEPDNEPEEAPNLQRRDLVIALVTLTQELGHLPTADEINEHGEYRHQRYREEFGDLFNAYQEAGILPDDVTRTDFYGEEPAESSEPEESEAEPTPETTAESEPRPEPDPTPTEESEAAESAETDESVEEEVREEPIEVDASAVDVDRPSFDVPEDVEEADLVREIQRFATLIGEPPTEELVEAYGRFPIDAYREAFGTWENSLEAAGCDPADLPDWSLRKYTNVEVLDGIRAVTAELGRPPMTTEVGDFVKFSGGLGSTRFGSWKTALELAGLDPSERPSADSDRDRESEAASTEDYLQPLSEKSQQEQSEPSSTETTEEEVSEDPATANEAEPSRQELLDKIKRLGEKLDRIPYQSDINQDGRFTAYTFRDQFGSWDEALEAAGIDKEAVLLEDMQQVADTVDGDITQPAMNEHGTYSASMAARFFGSWSDAKERLEEWEASKDEQNASAAESADIDTSSTDLDRPGFDMPADIDESDLFAEIQRFAEIIDEPPTKELVVAYGRYPADAYREAFGSWDSALETAGYDPEGIPDWDARSHTNTEILDGLRAVADELGRAPTTTETGNHVDFSPGLASLRFGSWGNALETAGLDPSERSSVQESDTSEQEDETADDREPKDDDGGDEKEKEDDPIGSVIDDTLENMLLSDDEDDGPL